MTSIVPQTAALLVMSALSANALAEAVAESMNWYRCNTHTHTSAPPKSDANASPEFVVEWYKAHGYQCLVITDHEFLTDVTSLNRKYAGRSDFLVIQGQEITQALIDESRPTGKRHFHINGIGIGRAIMPVGYPAGARGIAPVDMYARNIAQIQAAGGIPQINHPNLQWSVQLNDLLALESPFLMEVWNAFPTSNNLGGIDDTGDVAASTEALWDSLLSAGKVVWAVASDDTHEYYRFDDRLSPTPGQAWVVLQAAQLTQTAVMTALRQGRFYASTGVTLQSYEADEHGISMRLVQTPEWSPATSKPNTRVVTRFIGGGGRLLAEVTGLNPAYRFKGDERYVRAQIIDSNGRRAWTQPVFRDGRLKLAE
ncbi:CehA/McbA family metallohydrolase [Peristeroidobacter soli]|uniref:CehA/McbA family metallohydrolase n=1 Tax=Peristeroidobacter soli TaxID=2497877 RepID=UPI00101C1783|nr:CehA/McbA family metallohydrolase [Peristeroidobacter soli]